MNRKERMELARWAVEQAIKNGADEAAAKVVSVRSVDVEHRDGKLEKLQEATQNGLAVSVYADQRYSSHGTSDLRRDFVEGFIREAVAMTRLLGQDPFRKLPEAALYEGRRNLGLELVDRACDALTTDDRIRRAREIEATAREGGERVVSATAGVGDVHGSSARVSSNGFEGETETTLFYAGAEVTVRDDAGGRPEDWDYATVRSFSKLPDSALLGSNAARYALRKIGQSKIESGTYDMVVDNRVGERLVGILVGPMSAMALQQKSSFLDGMLGKQVGSPLLTLTDEPFLMGGLGSRLFDEEGISARERTMVDAGILKAYFVDNYYGRKLGMTITGGSASNLVLKPGTTPRQDLLRNVEKGILVTGFLGGNSNSTTGDFSLGVSGLLIEHGVPGRPVNEMNVSGNVKDLWKSLSAVGDDPYLYSSARVPTLFFKDVRFSGA